MLRRIFNTHDAKRKIFQNIFIYMYESKKVKKITTLCVTGPSKALLHVEFSTHTQTENISTVGANFSNTVLEDENLAPVAS